MSVQGMGKRSGLPKFVTLDRHRDGRPKYLYRRPGQPRLTLPGPFPSDAFWRAYAALEAGKPLPDAPGAQDSRRQPKAATGTLKAAMLDYYRAGEFTNSDSLTQEDKRRVLDSILKEPIAPGESFTFGDLPCARIESEHVEVLRDRKAIVPNAANKRLTYLSLFFKWAVRKKLATANPVPGVPRLKPPKKGFHCWTPDEVRQYEAHHPIGTKARLALALMAFTGMRISDLCQVGKQHFKTGADGVEWLVKPQHKNRRRKPKRIEVPILPELRQVLNASELGTDLALLVTAYGQPFSIKGIGGRIKDWCRQAELPHCSAHGVRKAGATIAAENGATESQLMAIFNWEDAKEAIEYTRTMNRRRLAGEAIHMLVRRENANEIVTQPSGSENRVTKLGSK